MDFWFPDHALRAVRDDGREHPLEKLLLPEQQSLNRQLIIHFLSHPSALCRFRRDPNTPLVIDSEQVLDVPSGIFAYIRNHHSLSVGELDSAATQFLQPKSSLMHQVMVPATQKNQVFYAGIPTVGPVVDVMRFNKAAGGATRKTATAITPLQCTANGRWNGAGFTPNG